MDHACSDNWQSLHRYLKYLDRPLLLMHHIHHKLLTDRKEAGHISTRTEKPILWRLALKTSIQLDSGAID